MSKYKWTVRDIAFILFLVLIVATILIIYKPFI
jgi:hypothetical protein